MFDPHFSDATLIAYGIKEQMYRNVYIYKEISIFIYPRNKVADDFLYYELL